MTNGWKLPESDLIIESTKRVLRKTTSDIAMLGFYAVGFFFLLSILSWGLALVIVGFLILNTRSECFTWKQYSECYMPEPEIEEPEYLEEGRS